MTTLDQALQNAIETARHVKALKVHDDGDTDVPNTIFAYRGDDLVALVFPEEKTNRDAALYCARMAAAGFSADVLGLTVESWFTDHKVSPLTGQRWEPGEMQEAALNHDGLAKGWVSECLFVQVYNRAGDCATASLRYRLNKRKLTWEQAELSTSETTVHDGYMYDRMIDIMKEPMVEHIVQQAGIDIERDVGLNAEQARAHEDCAIAKVLLGEGPFPLPHRAHVMLSSREGGEREKIIRESMPPGDFEA